MAMPSVTMEAYHTAGCSVEILLPAFSELFARRVVVPAQAPPLQGPQCYRPADGGDPEWGTFVLT